MMSVGIVANGIRLRGRVRRLATLEAADAATGGPVAPEHAFLVAGGVGLTDAARRTASAHARREGLDVLDLIPADLPAERMLDVVRMVDSRRFRSSRFAPGRGANQAVLADRSLLDRAGIEERDDYRPAELAAVIRRLKRYAPTSTDHAVVPGVAAGPAGPAERVRLVREAHRHQEPPLVLPVARTAGLAAALAASPGWGIVPLALCWLQPYGVCRRREPVRPAELVRGPAARLAGWPAYLRNRDRDGAGDRARDRDGARARYQAEIAAGVDRYLEPRRDTCPWCGSRALSHRLTAADTSFRKPGRFGYDACRACGHVFQNPMLNPAGLDFYYRDFYDGLRRDENETMFGMSDRQYRARAGSVPAAATGTPDSGTADSGTADAASWLDVGTGHGFFCLAAKGLLPHVTFDGLDMGSGVEEAARRGWVRRAYRGMFPDLAADLAGRYDVISMFHYLEHTRDPLRELDAAAEALPAGGHLVIEVPNPCSPAFRAYRGFWFNLLPPQHLHLMPADNLVRALDDRGLRTVDVRFGWVHQPVDALIAVSYLVQALAPDPAMPWRAHRPSAGRRAFRGAATAAATPLFAAGVAVDMLTLPVYLTGKRANTYRLVARKQP
jgi:SAM-dependent methyltransferase